MDNLCGKAADLLEANAWCPGSFWERGTDTPMMCAVGAMQVVAGVRSLDEGLPQGDGDIYEDPAVRYACLALIDSEGFESKRGYRSPLHIVTEWNDGHSGPDAGGLVVDALRRASSVTVNTEF